MFHCISSIIFLFFYQRLVNETKTLNKNLGIEGADEQLEDARDALDRTNENMRVSTQGCFDIQVSCNNHNELCYEVA